MKLTKAGSIGFDEIDEQTQGDVIATIRYVGGDVDDEDLVRLALESGPAHLPLVKVDPKDIAVPIHELTEDVVDAYAEYWKDKSQFPPIIIDSSRGRGDRLLEGRHRTAGAIKAGKKKILAIDIAGAYLDDVDGIPTYVFGSS